MKVDAAAAALLGEASSTQYVIVRQLYFFSLCSAMQYMLLEGFCWTYWQEIYFHKVYKKAILVCFK